MVTLYDTLGVRDDATEEEIKRAYRKAAMRSHPDRNVGREAAAHASFQQVKEAYAILSDPEQRRVYDAVFAEEMRRLEPHREEERRRAEEERRRAEQERRRAEEEASRREAEYAGYVTLAMRFAEQGHSRDVLFGVLLGRDCEPALAARIADGVAALQASRLAVCAAGEAPVQEGGRGHEQDVRREAHEIRDEREADEARDDIRARSESAPANLFSTLWHGMFGLRS